MVSIPIRFSDPSQAATICAAEKSQRAGKAGSGVPLGADAALGRHDDPVTHGGHFLEHLAEQALGNSTPVGVGMVEERVASLVGGDDRATTNSFSCGREFGRVVAGNAPASVG
jgi:hypothetical protein